MTISRMFALAFLILIIAVSNRVLTSFDQRHAIHTESAALRELCEAYLAWSVAHGQTLASMEHLCRIHSLKR